MNIHLLFNNIFEEIYSEIEDLNYDKDLQLDNELDSYFTLQQIKEFQKFFFKI
ncbi:10652_t:CDS:2 [Scutellospora calospora]|uniref:10652_t:CDS:1 n=1 Tax=Scutellospora calospora TaxID=85575 RepID=A0ACA9KMH2_9GLOM|nr:10652_t:CDS:2 [Scutellospora calospora]